MNKQFAVVLWCSLSVLLSTSMAVTAKGIPEPLQLKRFAGHGTWEGPCDSVLGLSKMNWNNDALYDRLPVTMAYAQVLARVIKRMPRLLSSTYQFRFFM